MFGIFKWFVHPFGCFCFVFTWFSFPRMAGLRWVRFHHDWNASLGNLDLLCFYNWRMTCEQSTPKQSWYFSLKIGLPLDSTVAQNIDTCKLHKFACQGCVYHRAQPCHCLRMVFDRQICSGRRQALENWQHGRLNQPTARRLQRPQVWSGVGWPTRSTETCLQNPSCIMVARGEPCDAQMGWLVSLKSVSTVHNYQR